MRTHMWHARVSAVGQGWHQHHIFACCYAMIMLLTNSTSSCLLSASVLPAAVAGPTLSVFLARSGLYSCTHMLIRTTLTLKPFRHPSYEPFVSQVCISLHCAARASTIYRQTQTGPPHLRFLEHRRHVQTYSKLFSGELYWCRRGTSVVLRAIRITSQGTSQGPAKCSHATVSQSRTFTSPDFQALRGHT
jgi:hypothetical protein